MSKKKVKSGKSKKQAQENRYFFGALLTIGGLMIVGIAFAMLFKGGSGTPGTASGATGHEAAIQSEMESKHGAEWRELGLVNWEHNPAGHYVFHVNWNEWAKLSYEEKKSRADKIGKQASKIMEQHGTTAANVEIMFHDEGDRMFGTYYGTSGAADIQK